MKKILVLALMLTSAQAYAQEEQPVYVPPPLFGEQKLPPPKIKKPPVDQLPDVSREIKESKQPPQEKELIVKPRVVRQPSPSNIETKQPDTKQETRTVLPSPKPKAKPAPPPRFSDDNYEEVEQKTAEPVSGEPIDFLKEEKKEVESMVTGPKTMPANKKEDVDEVKLYEADENAPSSFELKPAEEEIVTEEDEAIAAIPMESVSIDQEQYFFVFKQGQKSLSEQSKQILDAIIVPGMRNNAKITLEMNAYASKIPDDPNGDRRLALDRGLAIREKLIDNGIESYRINLRSHGSNTTNQPPDYVEINVIGL